MGHISTRMDEMNLAASEVPEEDEPQLSEQKGFHRDRVGNDDFPKG
jgi:hypothetical protein